MTPVLPTKLEYRSLVGQGGMGQVHLAFDRERGHEVAIKLLAPPPGADRDEALLLFKQEFWAMASLHHPNLVDAYDYGELADGTPYFTMEYVPGRDLVATQPVGEAEVLAWLPGVVAALGYLHASGYVHGDLKPENIRLREDGLPKLMDLGLLTRTGRAGGSIRGTLAYMAPETIRQTAVDGRADLYGLGAVLYHLLTGEPPFAGKDPMAILRAHLGQPPAPPRERQPELSAALSGAVMRLLSKDRALRFPHAAALLEALGIRGAEATPAGLLGTPVIGREAQQTELAALLVHEQPATRWLVGEAGAGKSRLLQELRAEGQLAGLPVLFARGLGHDAPPYQALVPLLSALVDTPSQTLQRLAPVLVKLLPDAPTLRDAGGPAAPLDGTQERLRLQIAVAELALERHHEALWLVDDWDRLDHASRDLLAFIGRQGAERPWRWVSTGTEAPAGEAEIGLPALSETDVRLMASALLAQDLLPGPVADRIGALSGGQPGGIRALLDHWLRVGALRWTREGWSAGPEHLFEMPGGARVVLDAGFQALDEATRRVARAAAVLGQEGELQGLSALLADGQDAMFGALRALEDAGVLVVEHHADGTAAFRFQRPAHAALLLATCEDAERKTFHQRAARWLARRLGNEPEASSLPLSGVLEAARHHLAGDEPTHATLPWVLAAVRRANAMYELDAAEALLGRALALPDVPERDRLQLEVFKVNAIRHQGRTEEAIAYYRNQDLLARLEAANHPAFLDEAVTYGALLSIKSAYAEALPALDRVMAMADAQGNVASGVRARLFAGRVVYFGGDADRAKAIMAEAVAMARKAGLSSLLASTASFLGYAMAATDPSQTAEGLELLEEAVALNRQLGNLVDTNEVLSLLGNVLIAANRYEEAREAFQTGLDNSRRYGIDLDQVPARVNLGTIALELGDLVTARAEAGLGAQMAGAQGRKFLLGYAQALEGAALVAAGVPAGGADLILRGLALSREIGNRYLELHVLGFWVPALIQMGRLEEALDALALARQIARETQNVEFDVRFERFETQAALIAALASGELDRARQAEVADRIGRLVRRAHASDDDVGLAQALRLEAEWQLFRELPKVAAGTVDEALELARAHGLTGLVAELERLAARICLANGQQAQARTHLEDSLELAKQLGDRPLAVLNEHGLAVLNLDVGRQRDAAEALRALAADLPEAAREAYERLPERAAVLAADAATSHALQDRMGAVLDLMGALTEQSGPVDLDGVLELAVRAMVKIADADRGFLLLYDGVNVSREVFYGMSASESDVYSRNFADQVFYGREPVIMEDVQSDFHLGHQHSVQSLGLRGVVGVPLVAGDQAIGVIIADCRRLNARFGTDQRDMVVTLARQVAQAIVLARRQADQGAELDRLEVIRKLSLATAGRSTFEDFMAPVTRLALEVAGARRAYLLCGDPLACVGAYGTDGLPLPAGAAGLRLDVCQRSFATGRITSEAAPDIFHAVPIVHEGARLGVLGLEGHGPGRAVINLHAKLSGMADLLGAFLANREALAATSLSAPE